jgi:fumarate reductase subunit C
MRGKQYLEPTRANWWLKKRNYKRYILRESTAVFIAGYVIFLLMLLYRAGRAPDEFMRFLQGVESPVGIALHLIVLAMILYHTVTWFGSLPKAKVFWRGEKRVSPTLIIAPQYVVWAGASLLVVWTAVTLARG